MPAKTAKKAGKGKAPAKSKGCRQSEYSQKVGDAICERIAVGQSLRAICADESMPAMSTVFKWLNRHEAFVEQYTRAREEQAEALADEIVAIADEAETKTIIAGEESIVVYDSTAVARNRLRVDARKWVAAKLKPKKYGDKLVHAGDPDSPIEHRLGMSEAALEAVAATGLPKNG